MGARLVKPMLTKDLEDESLLDDPRFRCEEKYDGMRAHVRVENDRSLSILSRNEKPIDGPRVK